MKIINDIKDLLNLDNFLKPKSTSPVGTSIDDHNIKSTNLVGGTIGSEGKIYLGNKLYTMDGDNSRTVINDGANDRILIGKRTDGTYGIDVSSVGYSVHEAYESEMDLTSKATDDWTSFKPTNFTYSTANKITISGYTPSSFFQIGDRIKIVQTTAKYFVVGAVGSDYINVYGGSDYTVANATITEFYLSREVRPAGFPAYFNYTASVTLDNMSNITSYSVSDEEHRFTMLGNRVEIYGRFKVTTVITNTLGLGLCYVETNKPVPNVDTLTGTHLIQITYANGGDFNWVNTWNTVPIALLSHSTTKIRWGGWQAQSAVTTPPPFIYVADNVGLTPITKSFVIFPNNYYLI
jgi:hypothetical protein